MFFPKLGDDLFAVSYLALGFALSTIGLVNPSYQACYLLVAGFFVSARTVDVNLTVNPKVWSLFLA